ncbi:hypothetical protein CsSME_00011249 [Camellia sinensis var. sinensis]
MEKGQPHPHPHRRSRARTISTHSSCSSSSSSSSSTFLSNKFQTNPMRNATNSNPNPINNHDYSKRNTKQLQEEGEEDLLLSSTSIVGTCPFMCPELLNNNMKQKSASTI